MFVYVCAFCRKFMNRWTQKPEISADYPSTSKGSTSFPFQLG